MQDLLVEIGFEELPARFVGPAVEQLQSSITSKLNEEYLTFGEVRIYSTPRRLAVLITDLLEEQPDRTNEVKGPPKRIAIDEDGNLTKAGAGFARSQGVDPDQIVIRDVQGVEYLFVEKHIVGRKTDDLLPDALSSVIHSLSFPKNMRWGAYDLRFARPIRWILALFGSELIPLEVGPVRSGRITYGHRQLSAGPIEIDHPTNYASLLFDNYVLVDRAVRREKVWEQIQTLANDRGAVVQPDEALLDEVTNLVEFPTAFCGGFHPDYLEVPAEVLITSMKEHQRYFPLVSESGELLPLFIGVRNGADNHLENVVKGNEKVLAARLADAKFFYDEDRKIRLEDYIEKLRSVVFQEGLGTIYDKVERLTKLGPELTENLGLEERQTTISRTARLAKADLVTQMVNEFPELQGIMGEKYALLEGEDQQVATGIAEHYKPKFAGDSLPTTIEGTIVGIADKIDTLVGYFALGRIPTGSQDPFALRRQAQGVVQMLLTHNYSIPLATLIELAARNYTSVELNQEHHEALVEFLLARLRVYLLEQGYQYDTVDAVLASGDDRIPDLAQRIEYLEQFRRVDEFADLYIAYERVSNLAAKADKIVIDPSVFVPADQEFYNAVTATEQKVVELLAKQQYPDVLIALAQLRPAVDEYFDEVMIMDHDSQVRQNRLSILLKTTKMYRSYADFQIIVVNM